MLAAELLSNRLFPLKLSDTCGKALDLMNEYDTAFLPVVDAGKHLGYVAVSNLVGVRASTPIAKYITADAVSTIYTHQHLFEIITVFSLVKSPVISVVDNDKNFIGIISARELVTKIASLNAFSQPGSIITLEVPTIDYSLGEIARLVEQNNAKILSLYVNSLPETPSQLQVHIKLNTTDVKSVIAAFERYGYPVVASYFRENDTEDIKSRYDLLMKYLDT